MNATNIINRAKGTAETDQGFGRPFCVEQNRSLTQSLLRKNGFEAIFFRIRIHDINTRILNQVFGGVFVLCV